MSAHVSINRIQATPYSNAIMVTSGYGCTRVQGDYGNQKYQRYELNLHGWLVGNDLRCQANDSGAGRSASFYTKGSPTKREKVREEEGESILMTN